MAHALEPSADSRPDIGEPYRLSARLRKTWDEPVLPAKRVGHALREQRERIRNQLIDVSRALRIRASYLAAIEDGRFGDLPGHVFTIGYVGRYARYLGLDGERLQQQLEAEMAAHDGNFTRHVDIEVLPDRKFPVLGIACAVLLVAALIARDDVVSLATRTFDRATVLAHDVLDTPAPQIATSEPPALPFEIEATQPVSLRADLMPAITPTRLAALLLPMPVPSRIDVTARASLRAELLPQSLPPPLPPGTRYGVQNRNSRITLRVHSPTIVAVRDGRNRVFIDRKLDPGDTYRVPNRAGLWLTAVDASAVEIMLDGKSVGFAGAQGAAVKDLSLNPQRFGARETTRTTARPVRAAPNRATGKSRVRTRTTR